MSQAIKTVWTTVWAGARVGLALALMLGATLGTLLGVRPLWWTASGGSFDRLPGVAILILGWA
jgi:hypothetical protein